MRYYIALEIPDDDHTAVGVVVPDIPGCFSAGDTLDEAIANAEEAITLQLEDMIERNLELPVPSSIESFMDDYKESTWAFVGVEIDPQQLSTKARRINITVPEGALYLIDRAAEKAHTNRSAFLYESALSRIQGRNVGQYEIYRDSNTGRNVSAKTPKRRVAAKKKTKRKAV